MKYLNLVLTAALAVLAAYDWYTGTLPLSWFIVLVLMFAADLLRGVNLIIQGAVSIEREAR